MVGLVSRPSTDGEAGHVRGDCPDESQPQISSTDVTYRGKRVYITALLLPPKVPKGERREACAGVKLPVYKDVELDQDLAGSILFDASTAPAQRRWPFVE